MKVEIWTKDSRDRKGWSHDAMTSPVLLFSGEMHQVPRVGEFLNVFGFDTACPVLEVWWDLDDGNAELYVAPDWTGEYLAEAKKRGIPQRFHP